MERDEYDRIWHDPQQMRPYLEELIAAFPELFPLGIQQGFQLTGRLRESRKLPGIRLRQLRLADGSVYSLRPSFVLSSMTGTVDELSYPLQLLSHGVPCWLVTQGFGHNDMFWYRLLERFGRNSLVGTTVCDPSRMPVHLAADEHHTVQGGEKTYVALTAGAECVLGLALSPTADDAGLAAAYGVFHAEAQEFAPAYAPETVSADGWKATQNAWRRWFPQVAVIRCFLHGFLKIRDRCRKHIDLHRRVWEVYQAATAAEFHGRMAAFHAWCQEQTWTAPVREALEKLWHRAGEYVVSYAHPGCHRTSNAIDRLTNPLYRVLYAGRHLHGHLTSAERRLRGWALLFNFRPYAPRAGRPRTHHSRAHRLNEKQYHPHWLHNLQLSASLGGFRTCT